MANALSELSTEQLRRILSIREEISRLELELNGFGGSVVGTEQSAPRRGRPPGSGRKRRLSAAGKAKISSAARARWAKVRSGKDRAGKGPSQEDGLPRKAKRTMSAAGRARISAAAKARWEKVKAEGKTSL